MFTLNVRTLGDVHLECCPAGRRDTAERGSVAAQLLPCWLVQSMLTTGFRIPSKPDEPAGHLVIAVVGAGSLEGTAPALQDC